MTPQPAAPITSASALAHDHGTRCACDEQSMNALPWVLAAGLALLALSWLKSRRRAARHKRRSS